MARRVKIATFSIKPPLLRDIPKDMPIEDFMMKSLETEINRVLPDKPDLIVLPECSDWPNGLRGEAQLEYYRSRTGKVLNRVREIAKENHCYIAYSSQREAPEDGVRRNSVEMIGRNGETVGIYNKNYVVVTEKTITEVYPGEDITVFDCDFGRVGAIICFDLNFKELREKYKAAGVDLMLFCSQFHGGLMRNMFAYETQSYFVASCGWDGNPGEIINPLGESVARTTNYINWVVKEINLDCRVIHLDFNGHKLADIKKKYGDKFIITDVGYVAVVLLTYEGDDQTIDDVIKEFDLELVDDYFARSRAAREEFIAEYKALKK